MLLIGYFSLNHVYKLVAYLAAFFCSIILTIKKGGQITSQLELKEITLRCSKSEYRTQLNYKGSVLNF